MVGYCCLFVSSSSNLGVQNVFSCSSLDSLTPCIFGLLAQSCHAAMPFFQPLFFEFMTTASLPFLHSCIPCSFVLIALPRRHKHLVYHSYPIFFHRKRAAPHHWPYSHRICIVLPISTHLRIYNIPCITLIMVHTYTHTIHWCT